MKIHNNRNCKRRFSEICIVTMKIHNEKNLNERFPKYESTVVVFIMREYKELECTIHFRMNLECNDSFSNEFGM